MQKHKQNLIDNQRTVRERKQNTWGERERVKKNQAHWQARTNARTGARNDVRVRDRERKNTRKKLTKGEKKNKKKINEWTGPKCVSRGREQRKSSRKKHNNDIQHSHTTQTKMQAKLNGQQNFVCLVWCLYLCMSASARVANSLKHIHFFLHFFIIIIHFNECVYDNFFFSYRLLRIYYYYSKLS